MKRFLFIFCLATLQVFSQESSLEKIEIIESTIKLTGLKEELIYIGLCDGDKLIFNFQENNNKEVTEIEILEYPNLSRYKDLKQTNVNDKIISINKTGIYVIRFYNGGLGQRICKYKVQRIPRNETTKNFNSTVYWRTINDTTFKINTKKYLVKRELVPKIIAGPSDFYINSGLNASLQGGKSRVLLPFVLPKNTVQWYYEFSATRSKNDLGKNKNSFNLVSQLTTLIDQTGIINFGIDALIKPPGADIVDIHLLDDENTGKFLNKTAYSHYPVGTRENLKSGIVEMKNFNNTNITYYLGLKNPDNSVGIHVTIEVVAIVQEEDWGVRDVRTYEVKKRKEPYLSSN